MHRGAAVSGPWLLVQRAACSGLRRSESHSRIELQYTWGRAGRTASQSKRLRAVRRL